VNVIIIIIIIIIYRFLERHKSLGYRGAKPVLMPSCLINTDVLGEFRCIRRRPSKIIFLITLKHYTALSKGVAFARFSTFSR